MTKRSKLAPRRPSKVVGAIPPAVVEVPITAKQARMVEQVEAAARDAINQRNAVLNTIAAAASYDGECHFLGLQNRDGKFFILLAPTAATPQGAAPAAPESPAKE